MQNNVTVFTYWSEDKTDMGVGDITPILLLMNCKTTKSGLFDTDVLNETAVKSLLVIMSWFSLKKGVLDPIILIPKRKGKVPGGIFTFSGKVQLRVGGAKV